MVMFKVTLVVGLALLGLSVYRGRGIRRSMG